MNGIIYMWHLKKKGQTHRNRVRCGLEDEGIREWLVSGYTLSAIRRKSLSNENMVTIVYHTVLCNGKLLREQSLNVLNNNNNKKINV